MAIQTKGTVVEKKARVRLLSSGFQVATFDRVDEEEGVIYGVSTCGVGEAKGHGVHLDRDFIGRLVELGQSFERGVKSRFGHPNMCARALGTYLGKYRNWRVGETVRKNESGETETVPAALADLHLSDRAKKSPEGDLHTYVLEMARDEPDMFGASIVFTPMSYFRLTDEGQKVRPGDKGWADATGKLFAEIGELHACDAVDDPAANDGLFSRFSGGTMAAQVTEFLDLHPEVLTLLENEDVVESLSLYGDQVDGFLTRYREYRREIDVAEAEPNSAGETGIEIEKEHDMDLAKILADEHFQALCKRLGFSIPEGADEAFVMSVYEKANSEFAAEVAARESAETDLTAANEALAAKPTVIETTFVAVEPEPTSEFSAEDLKKLAAENPAVAHLLAKQEEADAKIDEQGSQLSTMTDANRVSAHASALEEAEAAAADGKLNEKGVEAYAKLLNAGSAKRLVLDSEGNPQFEDIDVAEASRALLAALPDDAAVPLSERTTRVNGKTVQELRVVKNDKDDAELSDSRVAELAAENLAMIGM